MSIQKIIQESIAGNPLEMKEALVEELRSRIALALEAKMDEDFEQIDEVIRYSSSEALKKDKEHGFYADEDDGYHHVFGAATGYSYGQHDNKSSAEKHARELNKAHSPHIKEDFDQLDEISKKTLASYVSKAADNAASKAVEYGAKKAQSDEMDRMMNRHMSYSDKDKVRGIMGTTSKDVNAPREKAAKRLAGISMAAKKLAKESFDLSDLTLEELEDFMMSEEFEQLDELDKKTLASYVKKAAANNYDSGRTDATFSNSNVLGPGHGNPSAQRYNNALISKARRKRDNRIVGVRRAVDRLTKESFDLSDYTIEELEDFMMSEEFEQLDEISKKTLASYVKKASTDATMKSGKSEYEAGRAHDATYGGESPDHGAASRWRARSDKSSKTASNRLKGISRATDRLAK